MVYGMENPGRKLKYLAALLDNEDDFAVAEGIRQLREEEPFSGAISLLASHYDRNPGKASARAVESFMNDMHENALREEIIAEIRKERNPATTAMLIASCWQSGLDYSAYTRDFAEAFIKGDYGISVECLTVIENAVPELTGPEKDNIVRLVSSSPVIEGKETLTGELISILRM